MITRKQPRIFRTSRSAPPGFYRCSDSARCPTCGGIRGKDRSPLFTHRFNGASSKTRRRENDLGPWRRGSGDHEQLSRSMKGAWGTATKRPWRCNEARVIVPPDRWNKVSRPCPLMKSARQAPAPVEKSFALSKPERSPRRSTPRPRCLTALRILPISLLPNLNFADLRVFLDELAEPDTEKIGGLQPGFTGDALHLGKRFQIDFRGHIFHLLAGHFITMCDSRTEARDKIAAS